MKSKNNIFNSYMLAGLGLALAVNAQANEEKVLKNGSYIAPMMAIVSPTDDTEFDDGNGFSVALGYKMDRFAYEIVPSVVDLDGTDLTSIALNGLAFPFENSGFYLTAGFSASNYKDYPVLNDKEDFSTLNFDAGIGYMLPFSKNGFAVRAEARYRVSHREDEYNDADVDLAVPGDFEQTVISVGLQIPLGN